MSFIDTETTNERAKFNLSNDTNDWVSKSHAFYIPLQTNKNLFFVSSASDIDDDEKSPLTEVMRMIPKPGNVMELNNALPFGMFHLSKEKTSSEKEVESEVQFLVLDWTDEIVIESITKLRVGEVCLYNDNSPDEVAECSKRVKLDEI